MRVKVRERVRVRLRVRVSMWVRVGGVWMRGGCEGMGSVRVTMGVRSGGGGKVDEGAAVMANAGEESK